MLSRNIRRTRIPAIILALLFFATGGMKLMGSEMVVQQFQGWDYPIWFVYVVGILEVAGAALILFPKVRFFGSLLLACIMAGAVGTHLMHGEITMAPLPALLLVVAGWTAHATRPETTKPSSSIEDMEQGAKRFPA